MGKTGLEKIGLGKIVVREHKIEEDVGKDRKNNWGGFFYFALCDVGFFFVKGCEQGKKKKLEYFIIYVNREEICVVGLDFVDVWGNCGVGFGARGIVAIIRIIRKKRFFCLGESGVWGNGEKFL